MSEIAKKEATKEYDDETARAQVDIWKYVFGFSETAVVKCAVELGIPDILENHGGPMTLSQLSSALSCSSPALFRIMRFLVNRGIFKETAMGYAQTPLSRLLMKDGKDSMAAVMLFLNSSVLTAPLHFLSASVLDEKTSPFVRAYGKNMWQYAAESPGFCKLVDEAMACGSRKTVPEVLEGCPEVFDGLSSVVNVGGGDGTALRMIIKECPWISGINFDLPHVLSVAPTCEGIEHISGDMFVSVPKANAAFLKLILHDWNDEKCIQILKNCREAISEYGTTGKVIIVETIVEDKPGDKLKDVGLFYDMLMFANTDSGKERTADEWAYILSEGGFTRHTIKDIGGVLSVIEAYP